MGWAGDKIKARTVCQVVTDASHAVHIHGAEVGKYPLLSHLRRR